MHRRRILKIHCSSISRLTGGLVGFAVFAAMVALTPAVRAQGASAAGADDQFLRAMADLNKGFALLAHETMHRAGTFPSKAEASNVDKQHDDDMDHLRAALKMVGDDYTPKATHADEMTAAALGKTSGSAYDAAFRHDVVALDRREIRSIDDYLPRATNPTIKTLAGRMRASADTEAKGLGG